ncbi:MAG: hypothetical protein EOO38_25850 [Cytophagaceae bacterium]|nr:MAG: hypothetical protein EOO38_25850 [Cytophagaceae bacterium]
MNTMRATLVPRIRLKFSEQISALHQTPAFRAIWHVTRMLDDLNPAEIALSVRFHLETVFLTFKSVCQSMGGEAS